MKVNPITKMQKKIDSTIRGACINCGREYLTHTSVMKYCSSECAKEFNKENNSRAMAFHRETIFRRDKYKCIYCGRSPIEDDVKLHLEHVYPISQGGGADTFNLVTSCQDCNLEKHNKLLPEDVIMRIWSAAHERDLAMVNDSYDEMKEVFKRDLERRVGYAKQ